MASDQISFYDESLKKQIEGSFVSQGKGCRYQPLNAGSDTHLRVTLLR